METAQFEILISKRKQWVQSSKENNFDFDSILAGIYNDPSHFIYEILQNAEDANANKISFVLYRDCLEIKHNGKDFNFNDVDGITGIGISTKKEDMNTIGKFGVGFKSVFAITQTPIIHSGIFHFKIKDFVIPSLIDSNRIKETLFVLPFNHPSRTKEEVFEIVRKKLESIGLKTLLFLKNIKEIKWQSTEKSGHYYKESNNYHNLENVSRVAIISKIEQEENFENYLVFKQPIRIETHNLNVELAYRIGTDEVGKDTIEKERDSKLIVFFPTEKVTYLNFLIQGPYKTTPNRENIPLDDEQNQYLIEETANLLASSISIIKKLGLLTVSFLEILPIDQNQTDEIIYSSMFKKVKEKLSSNEALLPTPSKDFTTPINALLARGKELIELFDETDINIVFNKKHWLDTNITYDRTRQLRDYLIKELKIKETDFKDFVLGINKELFEKKSDDWLIQFYCLLLDKRYLWAKSVYLGRNSGVLRDRPIIRLSDNTHISPCDRNDKLQVYLPAESKSKYKTVKEILVKNENALKFLKELGLSRPDIFAEIKEFIVPKYINPNPEVNLEEYFEDVEKLLIAFEMEDSEKRKVFISDLKDLHLIYSRNSITGELHFCKPFEVYIKSEGLIEFFMGFDHVFFVSGELEKRFSNRKDKLNELLLNVGCENKPRRINIESTLTSKEKNNLRQKNYYKGLTNEKHTYDFDYEGLDNFLKNLTMERSCILWNFLLSSLSTYNTLSKKDFFMGEYSWFYYTLNMEKYESKFLKTLKTTAWIINSNGICVLPTQISSSELPDDYQINENVEILIEVLDLKIDEIKRIEEKYDGVFLYAEKKEKFKEFLKWENEKNDNTKSEDDNKWIPEVKPENAKPTIEVINPEITVSPDLGGQRPSAGESVTGAVIQEIPKELKPKKQSKDIGDWGERIVYDHLQEKFANEPDVEIIWLNIDGNVGKGYDLSIVVDSKELEYIEVKSKVDDAPQLFEITGTQWEFARKLYSKNEGDKYKIYVVSNTGSESPKIGIIKNPIRLWKEGRLYAHPVHFKL